MRTYKKRIITDVVSVGMLLLAVGLILLMHRYMGDVKVSNSRNDWRNTDSSGYVCVDLLQ